MRKNEIYKKGNFIITTDKEKLDILAVFNLLKSSYWASEREKSVIIQSIKNSLCYSLFYGDEQIGFARVITDFATYAYLCDLIIDSNFRGQGLGKWLVKSILNHPQLCTLKKWSLHTRDAQELYKQFGFAYLENEKVYMQKNQN
ncbi:GNAT family N-acetyltransferase [Abyssisolibacter fermentans]|uniref:GNAT family N-acetyltransferase n=1 Tax=Abyssisolibacter fermentans TaxID=1766203 RepID=UPI000833560D|nr:GNAT family N-acetyltransferase [Abyssisolibacter fermentans]